MVLDELEIVGHPKSAVDPVEAHQVVDAIIRLATRQLDVDAVLAFLHVMDVRRPDLQSALERALQGLADLRCEARSPGC